jgi:hypothetical protein
MERVAILVAAPTRSWPVRLEPGEPRSIGARADVRVADAALLEVHVVVTADDQGSATVEARGPALLNGVQLSAKAQVRPGDEIEIGDTLLIFQSASDAPAESQRVWPWEAFQWLVQEELDRGVRGEVRLSRTRPSQSAGRVGSFHDKLFAEFLPGASEVTAADAFELFEAAMASMLGLSRELEQDEQLTQDAVMLRLLALGERLSSERASVLITGEAGSGKTAFARRIAPTANGWRGETVAPSGPLFVRQVESLESTEQLAAALRAGRQVVATSVDADESVRQLFPHVVMMPPLRARAADLDALAEVFLTRARRAMGLRWPALSAPVRAALHRASYPRNLSELKFAMEVAAVVSDAEEVLMNALPASFSEGAPPSANLRVSMKNAEKEALLHALGRTRWNVSEAARILGLPRRTVVYRMSKLGLRRPARQ